MLSTKIISVIAASGLTPAQQNAVDAVNDITRILLEVFKYAGIILLALAVGKLILAFKDESTDEKVKATIMLAVAVFMVAADSALSGLYPVYYYR